VPLVHPPGIHPVPLVTPAPSHHLCHPPPGTTSALCAPCPPTRHPPVPLGFQPPQSQQPLRPSWSRPHALHCQFTVAHTAPSCHPSALSGLGLRALAAALVPIQLCCGPCAICPVRVPLGFHATSSVFGHFGLWLLQLSHHRPALLSQPLHATRATQYDSFMPFVLLTWPCFPTRPLCHSAYTPPCRPSCHFGFRPPRLSATPAFMPPYSAFVPLSFHTTIRLFFVTNMLHWNESNHTRFSHHGSYHCPVPPLTTSCHSQVPATPESRPLPSPSHPDFSPPVGLGPHVPQCPEDSFSSSLD